jgi:hypothetical protein
MTDPVNPIPVNYRRPEPKAEAAPLLDDLAQRIKTEHHEIMGAKRNIVERAMKAGDLLLQAKAKAGHGNWLNWLKANCVGISERTANVYMKLAEGRAKIEEKLKSAATADLTINEALRSLVEEVPEASDTSTGGAGVSGSTGGESKTTGTGNSSTVTVTGSAKPKGGGRKASKSPIDNIDDATLHLVELLQALKEKKPEEANGAVNELMKLLRLIGLLPETELKKAA